MSDRGGWASAIGQFDRPASELQATLFQRNGSVHKGNLDAALASMELPFALDRPPRPRDGELALETVARVFSWSDVQSGIDGAKAAHKAAREACRYVQAVADQRNRLIQKYQDSVMDAIVAGKTEMPRPSEADLAEGMRLRETAAFLTHGRRRSELVAVWEVPNRLMVPETCGMRVIRDHDPQRVVLIGAYGLALSRVLRESKSKEAQQARDTGEGLVRTMLEWARAEHRLAAEKPPHHGDRWPDNRARQAAADQEDAEWLERHAKRVLKGADPESLLWGLNAMAAAARIPAEIDELAALPA